MSELNWKSLVGLVALMGIVGCATEGPTGPDTVEVTGTVSYGGSPVEGAVVKFSPSGSGHAASGTTDASGNFALTTTQAGDGAVLGSYAVTVSKVEGGTEPIAGGEESTEEDPGAAYEAMEAAGVDVLNPGASGDEQAGKDLLPAKYKTAATSNLTAEVTADGDNHFEFNLED